METVKYTEAERAEAMRQRIVVLKTDGAIRRQTCPVCSAEPGEDCHTMPGWWWCTPHAPRKRLAGVQ